MEKMEEIKPLVDEWLRLDRNASTRQEIEDLWNAHSLNELEKRLATRIEFGTAGLRGRMEAGFSRMNDLIIIQASQGLCAYVKQQIRDASSRGVVIGHDHRHNSAHWAALTASAFVAHDVKVYLHRGLVHTPLVPFSVKHLGAACGVMITASHNPKQDNGYKVYWENAVQIISPHDKGISDSIKANLEPKCWDVDTLASSSTCIDVTEEMKSRYFQSLTTFVSKLDAPSTLQFVNTSMHGVSAPFIRKVFQLFDFPEYLPVPEQEQPDPEFPTVSFPNPEEKGALTLAMRYAESHDAIYVLAQDPDSDRFTAAEKGPDGTFVQFTGDQLGTIFARWSFEQYKASGKPVDKLCMVASTVSSKMVEKMASVEKFKFVETLTGFKYIGNAALDLVASGYEVPFGYEEAIGYMFGPEIRDKDGVAATSVFVKLACELYEQGKSVRSYLQECYDRYGYFETRNSYFICHDPATIASIFEGIRMSNKSHDRMLRYPHSIGGLAITAVNDLSAGFDSTNAPSYKPKLPFSPGPMIQFRAGTGTGTKIALTIRTSGTEPKIKYYLEASGEDRAAVSTCLAAAVTELRDKWMDAPANGFQEAS